MFHRKRAIEPETYPDDNHNGVPDAFEDRLPLAEVLGFEESEPDKPLSSLDFQSKIETEFPPQKPDPCKYHKGRAFISCIHATVKASRFCLPSYDSGYIGIALCERSEHYPSELIAICEHCAFQKRR